MNLGLKIGRVPCLIGNHISTLPNTLQESPASLDTVLRPCCCRIKSSDKHLICTKCIRTVGVYYIIRIDHVSTALAHFLTVLAEDHTM